MKKTILLIFTASLAAIAFKKDGSVAGQMFPSIECEDYNGKKVNLPIQEKDKCTLLGIAFSNDAEKELQLWINPICSKYAPKKDTKNADAFAIAPTDINLFFIPKFSLLNQVMSKKAKEKIKADTDKELYPYLLFYSGDKPLKKELDIENKDVPYIFVLDKTGKILYSASGKYDSKKLDKINDIIDEN